MSGRPDISQYCRTVYSVVYVAANRCAIIIRVMCYAVKVASPLTIFGISKGKFQRLQKTSLYLLGHFQEKYQRAKNNSVQPGQNFQNPLPTKLVGSLNFNFCPSWTEVKTTTSTQLVSKSKITSTQFAEKSGFNFYTDCAEVNFEKKQGTNFFTVSAFGLVILCFFQIKISAQNFLFAIFFNFL